LVAHSNTVHGHVDVYLNDCISGWAFDPSKPEEHISVEVLHNTRRLCVIKADKFREDLQSSGFGDGKHGFEILLPLDIFAEPTVVLRIRVADSGPDLMGSPMTLHNHRAQLNKSVLETLGQAIVAMAGTAQTPAELAELGGWLLQNFDVVYQRQALLADEAGTREMWFHKLIGDNTSLSDVLRQAAAYTVERYGVLELPTHEYPEVSVVIPAYNHFDVTYRCLRSIVDHLPKTTMEVIVVDDASTDETVFAALVLSGGVRLLRNGRNLGFLDSAAAGIAAARGRVMFLLNNDCEVQEGWLDYLVETLARDPSIGIVGSKLLFPNGLLQEAGGIIWRQATGMNYGRGEDAQNPRYCFMRDADYVSGAALMIKRSVFDAVGGFSEEFKPGYYEDTDLCFKVRSIGHRIVVQPRSKVIHHEGVSSGTDVNGRGMKRYQRINQGKFLVKWFDVLQSHSVGGRADAYLESERGVSRRLLFIDVTVPAPDQDAGSNAALEHMLALQRLGFKVAFVGADNMARIPPYTEELEARGIECYYAPYYWSVEQIFRQVPVSFDVVYLHRLVNMSKYYAMVRQRFPEALVVYSVADLHYLRLEREAEVKRDSKIGLAADQSRQEELALIGVADSVIVHSSFERAVLAKAAPGANTHLVPWVVREHPVEAPFGNRYGVAFVGGFNHTPNVDAAVWLVEEIMPIVWSQEPELPCLLIGSNMPEIVQKLASPLVRVMGHLPRLGAVLGSVRLTVAPLRFGAGLKGKVLISFAAGLPCAATPTAVEGMDLPEQFGAAVASTAADLAERIVALHRSAELNAGLSAAGLALVRERFSEAAIDRLLAAAIRPVIHPKPSHVASGSNSPTLVSAEAGGTAKRRRA
jgi:GT2 family glycosyltransferase/glycosyltransferase involved in cell wall biosynthesis